MSDDAKNEDLEPETPGTPEAADAPGVQAEAELDEVPTEDAEAPAAEADADDAVAEDAVEADAEEAPAAAATPVVEAAKTSGEATDSDAAKAEVSEPAKPKRSRAKKAADTPAPAAKPARRGRGAEPTGPVVRAHAKYVRTSARKARLVCDHIRGKSVTEARAILAHTPRAVSEDWSKLLESAVANAEHNHELLGDDLWILSVTADEGPTLKRFRPRAMGRASAIRKRTSHLSIALTPKES
jgi:ribosomal protein L22